MLKFSLVTFLHFLHVCLCLHTVHSSTPPLSVVRKFAHLLELGDNDIRQEGELLRLREEVVRTIRSNRQLEADLDLMDLKIGLLVRNRVTLQVRNHTRRELFSLLSQRTCCSLTSHMNLIT